MIKQRSPRKSHAAGHAAVHPEELQAQKRREEEEGRKRKSRKTKSRKSRERKSRWGMKQ